MKSVLIIGAGFAGCTSADLFKQKGYKVTVLEGSNLPGGGCWTRTYGGHPYTFGPRMFYTDNQSVIDQVSKYVKIRNFEMKSFTYVEDEQQLFNYPLQYSDFKMMKDYDKITEELEQRKGTTPSVDSFENYWLDAIGPSLYNKFVNSYSAKMWGINTNKELEANFEWVNRGTPIRDGDNRLYGDKFQGYPESMDGYNQYFVQALDGVDVLYGCFVDGFDYQNRVVKTSMGDFTADIIINTIHIDTLFNNEYGQLRYFGREFLPFVLPVEYAMPEDCTWVHYSGNERFTRITEFKKITGYKSDFTLLGLELPSERGRFYPVQSKPELQRLEQYKSLYPENFFSIGRLGTFKYKGIVDAVEESLEVMELIK